MLPRTKYATRLSLVSIFLVLAALPLARCSRKVPVQELGQARLEIEQATAQQPKDEALGRLNEAKNALLDAHALLPEQKYGEAANKAIQARKLAMISQLDSAPAYGLTLKGKAEGSIALADEAYAEALARDDFEAARKLNEEGQRLLNEAEAIEVKPEQRSEPLADNSPVPKRLEAYRTAFQKLNGSVEAGTKARAVALSQKPDMLESAGTVEAMLAKAREYNAEKYDAAGYREAVSLIQSARGDIGADKLKSANGKIVAAEGKAAGLLEVARKGRAQDLLGEAEKASNQASAEFGSASPRLGKEARLKNGEYLKASKEALTSAKQRFGEQMFEESIQESRESLRLSQLVREASMSSASRESTISDGGVVGDGDTKPPAKKEEVADGSKYRVRKTVPPDSLWRIAGRKDIYGSGAKWKRIYEANKKVVGANPDLILPGQELTIPRD